MDKDQIEKEFLALKDRFHPYQEYVVEYERLLKAAEGSGIGMFQLALLALYRIGALDKGEVGGRMEMGS
jgi:hypothetical protein